jgi:hypothetical protein
LVASPFRSEAAHLLPTKVLSPANPKTAAFLNRVC